MTDELTTAWLAGLLEGEGYFGLVCRKGRASRYLTLRVSMTDEDIIKRAAEAMGGATIHRIYSPRFRENGWQPQYSAALYGDKAIAVIDKIYPYLGERRRAAIDKAMAERSVNREIDCANPDCGQRFTTRGVQKFYCSASCQRRAWKAGLRLRGSDHLTGHYHLR
jgi:hypothetical protein